MADTVDFDPAGLAAFSLDEPSYYDESFFNTFDDSYTPTDNGYSFSEGSAEDTGFGGSQNLDNRSVLEQIFQNKAFRALASLHPVGRAAMAGYGVVSNLANKNYTGAAQSALTGFGGLPGAVASMGIDAYQGKPIGDKVGSLLGGAVGSQSGLPGGGMLGSMFGAQVGKNVGNTGSAGMNLGGNTNGGGGSMDWETILPGLAQIYSSSRANSAEQAAASQAGSLGSLGELFGPNSATAQAMRQQIERRDAAAGRRSQYGPREVELAAALAKLQADAAPGIMNANTNAAQQRMLAAQHGYARKNQMLGTLLGVGKRNNWFGLNNMFNNNGVAPNYSEAYGQGGPSMGVYGQAPRVTSNPQEVENLYGNSNYEEELPSYFMPE